jgi:regulator of protease activity HflC (stomatin/prohibitin superfamily)
MDIAVSIIALIFLVAIALCIIALIPLAITYPIWTKKLANRKLFFKNMKSGEGSWITKNGKAWRYITSDATTDPDPDDEKCYIDDEGLKKNANPGGKLRTPGGKFEPWWVQWIDSILPGGMRWIGVPWIYEIYEYNFRWSVLREGKPLLTEDGLVGEPKELESGKFVAFFAKRLDNNFTRDAVYYSRVSDAETRGANSDSQDKSVGMAISIDMPITMRIVNPYRAFFDVHDWLESTLDLLRPSIRSWIASKPYQEVVGKPEVAEREFDTFLQSVPSPAMGKCILAYLEDTYGVRIKRIAFDTVIPPEEYATATTKRAETVQQAVTIETLAQANSNREAILAVGQAKAIRRLARAEAGRIKTIKAAIIDGDREAGLVLEGLETLKQIGKAGNTVIVGGTSPVQMLLNTSKGRDAAIPQQPNPRNQPSA